MDDSFYAADVTARGLCSDSFVCEGFSPSSATVKVRREYFGGVSGRGHDNVHKPPFFHVSDIDLGIQQRVYRYLIYRK